MLFCGGHTERTNVAGVGCRGLLGMRAVLGVFLCGDHREMKNVGKVGF